MPLLHWPFRQKRSDPWERLATAKIPQVVHDTRRYLDESAYQLPKDAEEDIRLNFQHYALFHAIGTHVLAPVSPPLPLILDVGCGTGIWANEVAHLFPDSLVLGIDLSDSSFQPTAPRCLLRTGDVLAGLPFPDALFAYAHQRLLVAAIPAERWPGVVHELVRVTSPGGWLELVEVETRMQHTGPATASLLELLESVSRSQGFVWQRVGELGDLLRQEGLDQVTMQPIPVPVGEWAGRVGQMLKQDLLAATNALRGRYCTQAGISVEAFDQLVSAMAAEWEALHSSCLFYAACGKRGEAC